MKKILTMTFGTFDDLHEGHKIFLREAATLGNELLVVLSSDKNVKKLKNYESKLPYLERKQALEDSGLVDVVVESDKRIGSFKCIKRLKPDVIALGYDQIELKSALDARLAKMNWQIPVKVLKPHLPKQYKSSILRKNV